MRASSLIPTRSTKWTLPGFPDTFRRRCSAAGPGFRSPEPRGGSRSRVPRLLFRPVLSNFLKHIVQRPWRSHRVRRARKLFEAAIVRKDRGDYEGARRGLEHAIFLDPEHADAYRWLGVLLAREQDYAGAAANMERALALNPETRGGWMDLGAVYYFQGDLKRAGASYRAALIAAPESGSAHGNLGKVLKEDGRFDEALLYLRSPYVRDPLSEGVFRNMANTLFHMHLC